MITQEEINKVLKDFGSPKWGVVHSTVPSSLKRFKSWISKGLEGALKYLSDERAIKRENLKNYYPDIESTLVIAFDYSEMAKRAKNLYRSEESNGLKIANYVFGFDEKDYHFEIRDELNKIGEALKRIDPELEYKFSLDTQPILERDFAYQAGLGWFGKNSMLINKEIGSYFIIGSLLLNKRIDNTHFVPDTDHCGNCVRCIQACPTLAIDPEERTIIADKCISTFTIEHFKEIAPPLGVQQASGEIFGCDICQDVCPWNTKVEKKNTSKVQLDGDIANFFLKRDADQIFFDLEQMSNREYRRRFARTPLERTGRIGMLKNLRVWLKLDQDS